MSDQRRSIPPSDCSRCPRLARFRELQRQREPSWHNAPVPAFGPDHARLLVVGLAPGLSGANRTGRPFTGDHAGEVLYPALKKFGWASGCYEARRDDTFRLIDCRISNAVRCVPPQNKPTAAEITNCRLFLKDELLLPPQPRAVLCLGRIAHDSVVTALGLRKAKYAFSHGGEAAIDSHQTLFSTYHPSRYNINTGRLTNVMLEAVLSRVARHLADQPPCAS